MMVKALLMNNEPRAPFTMVAATTGVQKEKDFATSILPVNRRSFDFPRSVLAFFKEVKQEDFDTSTSTISSSSDAEDDNRHPHTQIERRQPGLRKIQQKEKDQSYDDNDDQDQRDDISSSSPNTHDNKLSSLGSGDTFDSLPKTSSLQSCLDLLSSHDEDLNRIGMQRLFLLTRGRTLSGLHRSETLAAPILVYGGQWGSVEYRLRYAFATMICDTPHKDHGGRSSLLSSNQRSSVTLDLSGAEVGDEWSLQIEAVLFGNARNDLYPDDGDDNSVSGTNSTSDESEYDVALPQGKSSGALHQQGLKVLANALSQILHTIQGRYRGDDASSTCVKNRTIPLHDTIWRNIIRSLVHNIETNHHADATGYSLKILRLLHVIHPDMIQPLLQQSLFPHLVHLRDYGGERKFPLIHSEAAYLLRRANYLW